MPGPDYSYEDLIALGWTDAAARGIGLAPNSTARGGFSDPRLLSPDIGGTVTGPRGWDLGTVEDQRLAATMSESEYAGSPLMARSAAYSAYLASQNPAERQRLENELTQARLARRSMQDTAEWQAQPWSEGAIDWSRYPGTLSPAQRQQILSAEEARTRDLWRNQGIQARQTLMRLAPQAAQAVSNPTYYPRMFNQYPSPGTTAASLRPGTYIPRQIGAEDLSSDVYNTVLSGLARAGLARAGQAGPDLRRAPVSWSPLPQAQPAGMLRRAPVSFTPVARPVRPGIVRLPNRWTSPAQRPPITQAPAPPGVSSWNTLAGWKPYSPQAPAPPGVSSWNTMEPLSPPAPLQTSSPVSRSPAPERKLTPLSSFL